MDDDKLREMRMQHWWDQQQAAMDEIRKLIATEEETAIGKIALSDREIHDLMTQYGDAPVPEWEWAKLIVEAGRPINGPPMMISWVNEEGVEERSTLSSQLFWFQAGWRASKMRHQLRSGGREELLPELDKVIGIAQWMQIDPRHSVNPEAPGWSEEGLQAWQRNVPIYRSVENAAKRLKNAVERLPKGHLSDDDEEEAQGD